LAASKGEIILICCVKRTREILLDFPQKAGCQSSNARIMIITLSALLRFNGLRPKYENRMEKLKEDNEQKH
jgi:hypothetical protein